MIATERQQLWCVTILDVGLGIVLGGLAMGQIRERLSHLPESKGIIEWTDGNIAAVDDFGPALVRIDVCSRIVASKSSLTSRSCPYCSRSKTSSWSVRHGSIERCSENGDIVCFIGVLQATRMRKMGECGNTGKAPLCLSASCS